MSTGLRSTAMTRASGENAAISDAASSEQRYIGDASNKYRSFDAGANAARYDSRVTRVSILEARSLPKY